MKELTKGEEQVMQVIWSIGQGFANEIMAAFPEPKPAYNTVLTVIKILENKGFVKHETFCRANRYSAAISKEEYSQRYLGVLLFLVLEKPTCHVMMTCLWAKFKIIIRHSGLGSCHYNPAPL